MNVFCLEKGERLSTLSREDGIFQLVEVNTWRSDSHFLKSAWRHEKKSGQEEACGREGDETEMDRISHLLPHDHTWGGGLGLVITAMNYSFTFKVSGCRGVSVCRALLWNN